MPPISRTGFCTFFVLIGTFSVLAAACSSPQGAPCDSDDDCFESEACVDGYCEADDNASDNGDADAGRDATEDDSGDTGDGEETDGSDAGFDCPRAIAHIETDDGDFETDITTFTDNLVTVTGQHTEDTEGFDVDYHWEFVERPDGSSATLDDPSAITTTFIPEAGGDYIIELTVTADDDRCEASHAQVEVESILDCPDAVAHIVDDGSFESDVVTTTGESVDVTGEHTQFTSGYDVDYAWQLADVPDGSTTSMDASTGVTSSFTPDVGGVYEAELTVSTPGDCPTNSDRVEIHANLHDDVPDEQFYVRLEWDGTDDPVEPNLDVYLIHPWTNFDSEDALSRHNTPHEDWWSDDADAEMIGDYESGASPEEFVVDGFYIGSMEEASFGLGVHLYCDDDTPGAEGTVFAYIQGKYAGQVTVSLDDVDDFRRAGYLIAGDLQLDFEAYDQSDDHPTVELDTCD